MCIRDRDSLMQGTEFCAFDHHPFDAASGTLTHSEDDSFTDRTSSSLELLRFVLVLFLAADECLIHFDQASETVILAAFSHAGFTQPLEHEPCRLLGNSDLLRHLHRTDTLPSGDKQVCLLYTSPSPRD